MGAGHLTLELEKRGTRWLPRHPGGDPGFRTLLTLYPDAHRAIVILSNSEMTPRWEIRGVIEAALDGKAIVLPEPPVWVRYRWMICFGALAVVICRWRDALAAAPVPQPRTLTAYPPSTVSFAPFM